MFKLAVWLRELKVRGARIREWAAQSRINHRQVKHHTAATETAQHGQCLKDHSHHAKVKVKIFFCVYPSFFDLFCLFFDLFRFRLVLIGPCLHPTKATSLNDRFKSRIPVVTRSNKLRAFSSHFQPEILFTSIELKHNRNVQWYIPPWNRRRFSVWMSLDTTAICSAFW